MRATFGEWWRCYGSWIWHREPPEGSEVPPSWLETLVAACILFGVLLMAGLAVGGPLVTTLRDVGVSAPAPHDDPDRVEIVGLIVDAGYGIGVMAVVTWALVVGRRVLPAGRRWTPEQVRRAAGRVVAAGFWAVLAGFSASLALSDWRHPVGALFSVCLAISFARTTFQVLRAEPHDDG